MNKPYVYVSCPMSVGQDILDKVISVVDNSLLPGWETKVWKRGTIYNSDLPDKAEAIVVILPRNMWGMFLKDISQGTRTEIQNAWEKDKPIYLAYKSTTDGEYRIYNVEFELNSSSTLVDITGVRGSSSLFFEEICDRDEEIQSEDWFFNSDTNKWEKDSFYDVIDEEKTTTYATSDDDLAFIMEQWDKDEPFVKSKPRTYDEYWADRRAGRDDRGSSIHGSTPRCITKEDLEKVKIEPKVYTHPNESKFDVLNMTHKEIQAMLKQTEHKVDQALKEFTPVIIDHMHLLNVHEDAGKYKKYKDLVDMLKSTGVLPIIYGTGGEITDLEINKPLLIARIR